MEPEKKKCGRKNKEDKQEEQDEEVDRGGGRGGGGLVSFMLVSSPELME